MNFKKTWKRFMNMSRSREGFTLVELIVVIAILAILAGVGIPVYSGYIKKANEAADQQLLGVINTAFGAACLENETNATSLADDSVEFYTATMTVSKYNTEFQKYFTGNNGKFKTMTQLVFQDGVFKNAADATGYTAFTYGDQTIYLSAADIAAVKGSNFMNTSIGLGTEALMTKVDNVTGLAAVLIPSVFSDPEFLACAAASMGLDVNDPNLMAKLGDEVNKMAADMVASGEYTDTNTAMNKIYGNAAVIFAAQQTNDLKKDDVVTLLTGENAYDKIMSGVGTDTGAALSQAAVAYGMYTVYAHKNGLDLTVANDPLKAMEAMNNNTDFQNYINSDEGKADLDGYLSALGMIDSSANNTDAVKDVLMNGYNNDTLIDMVEQAMGTK